jgi:glycosyltransferase involved in cell wall biosynthesis
MTKVLWLSPAFNHYKARFLNHLAAEEDVALTILAGTGRSNEGDQEISGNWNFAFIQLNISKSRFGQSIKVVQSIKKLTSDMDWILIPAEKKNLLLFTYLLVYQLINRNLRLISYNHPVLKSGTDGFSKIDRWLTKFFYRYLDRVVFYTEKSRTIALERKLIPPQKAYWANNTLDNTAIEKHYQFTLPGTEIFTLLFIGRLIPSKRIDVLLTYFDKLKENLPKKRLALEIIGDGPEAYLVKKAVEKDSAIKWHGTLVNEAAIAPIMRKANVVFIPGLSGLSVNHAFLYGRPYVTINSDRHGPEIHYLESGFNGLILKGEIEKDLEELTALINDFSIVNRMAKAAYATGQELSIQNWVEQMKKALTDA